MTFDTVLNEREGVRGCVAPILGSFCFHSKSPSGRAKENNQAPVVRVFEGGGFLQHQPTDAGPLQCAALFFSKPTPSPHQARRRPRKGNHRDNRIQHPGCGAMPVFRSRLSDKPDIRLPLIWCQSFGPQTGGVPFDVPLTQPLKGNPDKKPRPTRG